MGIFDLLKKRPEQVPLPQLCYDVAYFLLPHYAYHDVAKVVELCSNSPSAAGPFFYVMACQARKVEPFLQVPNASHGIRANSSMRGSISSSNIRCHHA